MALFLGVTSALSSLKLRVGLREALAIQRLEMGSYYNMSPFLIVESRGFGANPTRSFKLDRALGKGFQFR